MRYFGWQLKQNTHSKALKFLIPFVNVKVDFLNLFILKRNVKIESIENDLRLEWKFNLMNTFYVKQNQ